MRISNVFMCAALVAALSPAVALADDPNDPTMRSPAARARDREIIRQLNQKELARVRERDARIFAAYGSRRASNARDHERAMADYDRSRMQYERDMAEWRRAVAACRAGDYSACGR